SQIMVPSKAAACERAVCDLERGYTVPGRSLRMNRLFDNPLPSDHTEGVLFALAKVVEQRDSHTAGHCERLAFTGVALGAAMGLDSSDLLTLYLGGYLHDVGKVGIPDSILFKPGKLDDAEWELMCSHPVRGEEICKPLST